MTDDEIIDRIREQARSGGLPLPAPLEAVAELEAAVGHRMPPLLRRIHLEVADGGFGRWDGALSLTEYQDEPPVLEAYLAWREGYGTDYPTPVVPLLTWGCAIWSLVDFGTPEGRMWGWDPHGSCPRHALFPEPFTLSERLTGWLDGREDFPQPPDRPECPDC
ncbi:SMI1/KNR4 family protein [Kitasatospora putterlickiae]|uniref:SMI1/KNR4 family protein n=1 Tax=Kitasatospora putterlickiae TaxID=221725 RepID=A0ABN1XYG3_9ACTN